MNKKRREIISKNQISRITTYSLGGYEQRVLLDGKNKSNPIMLFLHGGPGMPIPFSVGCRGMFPEFTDRFIMVYWDQLGCGINNYPINDDFSINTFVDMTVDLVMALKHDFPDNQLIIFGVSWGSVLAAKAAVRLPGLVDNVLAYGQILKDLFFNEEVYEALRKTDLPPKAKRRVEALRKAQVHNPDDIKEIAALIRKYTEGYQAKSGDKMPMGTIIRGLLSSPDYSWKDFVAIVKNGFMKNKSIWNELMQLDLSDVIKGIQIPYRILQGNTDIVTSTKAVSAFVSESSNDFLSFRMINNSGHIPGPIGMQELLSESIKLIKEV